MCHIWRLFISQVVTISYASEKKPTGTDISQKTSEDIGNPLNDARFYSKMDPWKAIKINQESVRICICITKAYACMSGECSNCYSKVIGTIIGASLSEPHT